MMTQWSFAYLGTLIQSTFTYEEWIGYDIIFFKIPAGLLKLANKKNQQKTQQDFFSSHSLPCNPANPS